MKNFTFLLINYRDLQFIFKGYKIFEILLALFMYDWLLYSEIRVTEYKMACEPTYCDIH